MKYERFHILLLLIFAFSAVGCSPGHLGSNEIAFLRDGHLWTIDPDGANAFAVFADNTTPVVGYGWSPTHQLLSFRALDAAFAKTSAAKHPSLNPTTSLTSDVPAALNTIGIDGGSPIPIIFSNPLLRNSDAWWNTTGSRLLYREEITASTPTPYQVFWWLSQNDQPGGIARKLLPNSFSIPSIAPDNSLALGISNQGLFTSTLNGTDVHVITHGTLRGHPFFATLERALWQPRHAHPAILYALESSAPSQARASNTDAITVELVLNDMHNHTTILTSCTCTQFAWAPDGNHIIYTSGQTYTIVNLNDHSSFSIAGEVGSVPYWSPDSQFLLLDGLHTLSLVRINSQQQQLVLYDSLPTTDRVSSHIRIPGVNALLQPISNSLWATDSRHFLFTPHGRTHWLSKNLPTANGFYTLTIDSHGEPQSDPQQVDSGNDTQAGWSYEDPNTSFLF